jgi:NTE family protein
MFLPYRRHSVARRFARLAVLAAGWAMAAGAAASDDAQAARERPKIALVLSGGGALGLAHVGAIQELEAMGLRPDMVIGTSMGAVIGGLYASGMSSEELAEAVASADWAGIFNPAPQRRWLTFRQKQQQADFPGTASLGVSGAGIILPTGAISDQSLMKELRRLTPARTAVESFDHLSIPFRAVATDIATGQAVTLDRGELPMAMRASMSVPGVFAAVPLDGRLLVDGGLAANIPVSVAREMGADIVIAVWTPNELLPQEQIGSVVSVLSQTVSLLILANERAETAAMLPGDILLRVDTGKISPTAFTRSEELFDTGRFAVAREMTRLSALAAERPAPPERPREADPPIISFVRIENTSRLSQSMLEARTLPLLGQPADAAEINEVIDDVYALGPFERVDYTLAEQDGLSGIVLRAEDLRPDAGRLRLGLIVESDFNTESDASVSIDFRSAALDAYGSEIRALATIGDLAQLSLEYFRLLEPEQMWFASARIGVSKRPVNIFSASGFKTGAYDLTYGLASFDIGRQFGNFSEVRIGTEFGAGEANLREGSAPVDGVAVNIGRLMASAGIDTLDDPFFPREGLQGTLRYAHGLSALGERRQFQAASLAGLAATSRGQHTLMGSLAGGYLIDGASPFDASYRIGGLFSLSGYRLEELTGENYLAGRLVYRYALGGGEPALFGIPLFIGGSLEAGETWARTQSFTLDDLRLGGSVYAGANTALGPVYLAIGRSEGGRQTAYLVIGRTF